MNTNNIQIRETTPDDFNDIMTVDKQAFGYGKEAKLTADLLADKTGDGAVLKGHQAEAFGDDDGRPVGVADRHNLGVLLASMADGHQRVGGLAGLTDRDHQGRRGDDRIAVTELRGDLHLASHLRPVLDGVFRHHARVIGAATSHDDDLVDRAQPFLGDVQLVQSEGTFGGEPPEQGVGHGFRLLEDLLAHEPVIAVLFGRLQIPGHLVRPAGGGMAVEICDGESV